MTNDTTYSLFEQTSLFMFPSEYDTDTGNTEKHKGILSRVWSAI